MALTKQSVLREWIMRVLLDEPEVAARRGRVLDRIERLHRKELSKEDLEPVASAPHDARWRVAASFERNKMKNEGLLERRNDGVWKLTPKGYGTAKRLRK